MATGTGLPTVANGAPVLAQAPGGVSGDALYNAQSWNQVAAAGEKLAKAGGDYLKVSEHKAQVGYLSDQDVEIQRKQIEYRNIHANNPAGFDAAWSGYADGKLAAVEPWAVNHVRATLGHSGNTAFSAIQNETRVKSDNNARESWSTLNDQASQDVLSSAMAGTLNTPAGQVKIERYRGVVTTGVTSQFITRESADVRVASLESMATVYASRSAIQGTFNAEGPIAATRQIDEITRDEKLKLSPEQRLTLGSRLRADVHAWDAERNQSLATVDMESNALISAKQGGIPIQQSRIDEVVERYKKFGGQAQAASFLADIQHSNDMSFLSRAPLAESAAWIDRYKTARGFNSPPQAASTAVDFFTSRGWSKAQAQGIVGNLIHESGLNPNAVHDNNTGLGIAGHRLERLDAMRQFAAERGKPVNDFQTQLEFIDQELRTTEGKAGAAVRAATTPEQAAAAFIHFERPLGYDPDDTSKAHGYSNRVGQATRLAGIPPAPGPDPSKAPGIVEPGNIDLAKRPMVKNADGSVSTVRSLGVNIDGKETLIPTVSDDGRVMSNEEAIATFKRTGKHLGKFDTVANAEAFAEKLHKAQEEFYKPRPPAPSTTASDITFLGKANMLVSKRVSDEADAVIKAMSDKDSPVLPTEQKINDLLAAASATNMPEVLDKVSQAAAEYQFRRQFGRAPEPQEASYVTDLQHKARTEGLSTSDARRLEIATETRDRTAKALQDDPLNHTYGALSETAALPPPGPLDVANPNAFRAGLQDRAQWAATGTRTFETAPMPALTTAEANQVRAALDAADPAGKARIYSDIVASTTGGTRSATLQKLGSKGVDGMVEAYAGALTGQDAAMGESIIRGQSAMKAKEAFNPMKEGNKDNTNAAMDKYMPPSTFSLAARTDPQGAYATMRGAVLARAADLAATDPNFKGEFPDSMIQRAVNDVTGGVVTHNGSTLIAPARGVTQRGFDARMAGLTDRDLQGVTTQSGTPITAEYVRNSAQLESLSDGRYLVRLGRDAERPVYAFRDLGVMGQPMRPFVLDMRQIAPATAASIDPYHAGPLP
jgi:hypothetical protein